MSFGLPLLAAVSLVVQSPTHTSSGSSGDPPPAARRVTATRAAQQMTIDARDDEPVWRQAPAVTEFQEWRPTEGGAPKLPTEAKVAYDAGNLYIFVRCLDPHPDSIITLLKRRDDFGAFDMVWIFLDPYHDRRNGFEFGVNPSGVKFDAQIFSDGNEDFAWDAVWDVATHIDANGWTAEFRIPFTQLPYGRERVHTFGLTIDRDIYRYAQRVSWPLFRTSQAGFVSQFGELDGLEGLEPPRRLEAAPYLVTKNVSKIDNNVLGRSQDVTVGGDFRYRVASNLKLDATINPDFGQVEADPGDLNLTAFETFFSERRPFFVQGAGQFQWNVNCMAVNDCGTGEGLVYSRRIGRAPQLPGIYGDTTSPAFTTILGAAKLTGRLPGGLTIGALDAVTAHEKGIGGITIEPLTNYGVLRLRQDMRNGESSIGGVVTSVNRDNDSWSSPFLHSTAYVGGLDFRHRFRGGRYEMSGSVDLSRVAGSREAIAGTQNSSTHYYQRPDAYRFDSMRTTLTGDLEAIRFGKVSGKHLNFQTDFERRSPGFETNDLGYLQRADQIVWATWAGYADRRVTKLYNQFRWNFNWWQYWTTNGLPEERAFNTNWHVTFHNQWSLHTGGTLGQLGTTYCYDCARGGPAVRQSSYVAPWMVIVGDDRKSIFPVVFGSYFATDGGRTHNTSFSPEIDFRIAARVTGAISPSYRWSTSDAQARGPATGADSATHYVFSHLDRKNLAVTMRLTYPFNPNMTLQVYAQPFISKGTYSNIRELSATPRAKDYNDRYLALTDTTITNNLGTGFNFKQFRSNVVFRWEYRPGSTVFVVWSQGRQQFLGAEGTSGFGGDVGDLFNLAPDNSFLVKVSYWINR